MGIRYYFNTVTFPLTQHTNTLFKECRNAQSRKQNIKKRNYPQISLQTRGGGLAAVRVDLSHANVFHGFANDLGVTLHRDSRILLDKNHSSHLL